MVGIQSSYEGKWLCATWEQPEAKCWCKEKELQIEMQGKDRRLKGK